MDRRIPVQPLALALILAGPASAASLRPGAILASYSFDDDSVATGPDTFRIFQNAKGTVGLSSAFHVSGYRSIELHDVAGDRAFPEIQGYFPVRHKGRLYGHFSFLTATPEEELNIALAGPTWFQLKKDGIAFWLQSQEGVLVHYSDSMPKRLFRLEAFVWYTADVAYDIGAGTYDLTIRREGRSEPIVSLARQRNAANQPGSAVDKFSFVGEPFGDSSNVTYYVDDIVIGVDETLRQLPFVAPGRRKLFIDSFVEYQRLERQKPRCLPATDISDFGMTGADVAALARAGVVHALEQALLGRKGDRRGSRPPLEGDAGRRLEAVEAWAAGCAALERGQPQRALEKFDEATRTAPEGRIHGLSAALALGALKRFGEADERLAGLDPELQRDVRYAVASAILGTARGELDRAEDWLRQPAEGILARDGDAALRDLRSGSLTRRLIELLKGRYPDAWRGHLEDVMVSEQYYYVLLWNGRFDVARDYALRMVARLSSLDVPVQQWLERAGDAAFYARNLGEARQLYEDAAKGNARPAWIWLKLADIAFLAGDLEAERKLREIYYGVLRER